MEIRQIPISLVHPSPMNPRKTFDEGDLQELADNIEKQGLLQPITVRPIKDKTQFAERAGVGMSITEDEFEIICGERRYRAFKSIWEKLTEAGDGPFNDFTDIQAIVRDMNDEEAFAFGQLIQKGKTAEEVAIRFGKSIRFIQDRVKLNSLIPELILAVKDERMSISAAMIICKLDAETQLIYFNIYNAQGTFSKSNASFFVNNLFMTLDRSPWYRSDNQADEDFEGGCGRKCSECQMNTANAGCLFWEMKTQDAGRCTDRAQYEAKTLAYILGLVERYKDRLVKVGQPLEHGKVVCLIREEYCSTQIKELKKKAVDAIRGAGYEVSDYSLFSNKMHYNADDKRRVDAIKSGEVYECLNIFSHDSVEIDIQCHRFKSADAVKESEDADSNASKSVQAMKLLEQRKRAKEIAMEKIVTEYREMYNQMRLAKKVGDLSEAELLALDCVIFAKAGKSLHEKYGHKGYGTPSDHALIDVIRQNQTDRNQIYRDFLRDVFSSADVTYNKMYQVLMGRVIREWFPDKAQEISHKYAVDLDKKLARNTEKLKELGYGPDGKLLPDVTPKEEHIKLANPSKPVEEQYAAMKAKHPDAVILFRVGDFYESFDEDAETCADVLNITITTRTKGKKKMKLAGFPHHALDNYLPKLIRAGKRVAICENPEKPKKK